jgi:chorismate dehydratase
VKKQARPIRIGQIDFTNVWPMFHYFPEERFAGRIERIAQVPTQLNEGMRRGDIDMGPISSFAYGQSCSDYMLFPDLSVSAYGAVKSILLFHEKPLEDIRDGCFALPTTSATSVNLLKILLQKYMGQKPTYFYSPPKLSEMFPKADGALLIGDDAIRADWANRESGQYLVTDLGELWRKYTGRWMTFAVWAVRRQAIEEEPGLVAEIYAAFQESKNKSLADPIPMAEKAQTQIGGTLSYWRDYFANLCYDFNSQQLSGLQYYFDHAYELGLIEHPVRLELWSDTTRTR